MAFILETPNAFEPQKVIKHFHPGGITVRQWLEQQYSGFIEFELPTVCLFNGKALMRKDWESTEIKYGDCVNFVAVQGWVFVIIIIIVIALSVALALTMQQPPLPGQAPGSDPVYTIKGQQNDIRLGEPIETCYGRNRIFCSFASRPFYSYQHNEQFQFSLLCIGQGEYDIEQILIGDTDIEDFEEVTYQIIPPGGTLTLFPSNVYTSSEAGGQTLFASNEANWPSGGGWVGPFPANPPSSTVTKIEVDITFPKGLYRMKKSGSLAGMIAFFEAEKRLIDDSGNPLGDWTKLFTPTYTPPGPAFIDYQDTFFWGPFIGVRANGKTTTPIRKTYSVAVPSGRYEVRIRRTDIKYRNHKVGHDMMWEGLRGYVEGTSAFGDVTLLAVKIRATSNLNDRTQRKFSVIATRKLATRHLNGTWNPVAASRSIVWAFVDVFRSMYGGRVSSDNFFDWDTLHALDSYYEGRNEHFDWCFRDPITVWEAAKVIARAGRAIPLISGSLITIKRDGPLTAPVTMFTPENMVEGSFQWDIKLWDLDEHDSISVEYTEPDTGYKQEQVICTLPGGTTDNPKDVRLVGVQDRNHAYHEGLYLLATDRYLRENITFETGMEGFIPTYGDLVAIAHDVPRWSQTGYIVHAELISGSTYSLYLSAPVVFDESDTHQILLRGRLGQVIGPLTALETTDPKQVRVTIAQAVDFLLGGENEPMLFMFGPVSRGVKYGRIVKIEPQGEERIKMTVVNEAPIIHTFDGLTAPALDIPPSPPEVPDLPEVTALELTQTNDLLQIVLAAWPGAYGAQKYVLETSEDNENWNFLTETTRTSYEFQTRTGLLYVRVAGINNGRGPWITSTITVGFLSGLELSVDWADLEWQVAWRDVLNAEGYRIYLYDISGSAPELLITQDNGPTDRFFDFDYDLAVSDSNIPIVRDLRIVVDPMFQDDDGPGIVPSGLPVSLDLRNEIPEAPTNLGYEYLAQDSFDNAQYRLFWTNPVGADLVRIKVWVSETPGFDPLVLAPIYDLTIGVGDSDGLPSELYMEWPSIPVAIRPALYWRVAVFDVWGNELTSNLSAEATIPTHPGWLFELASAGYEWVESGRWIDTETWID